MVAAPPARPMPPSPPLEVPGWAGETCLSEVRLERATWAFVVLGTVLRVVRYATNQPLWGDEAYLAASLIDRGYLDLLRPLDYHQVAPPLFLWVERAAVDLFGFAEWSLRLFPLLCGVASVGVFHHVARATLSGVPRVLAVATFAVAFYPIRHATEIKPYASDLLVALVLIALAVDWLKDRAATWRLWALAAVTPLALGLSYPAVFVAGGIGLTLAGPVWRTRRPWTLGALAAFGLALVGSFLALYLLTIQGQTTGAGAGTHQYWADAFPPSLAEPGRLALWLIETHTSRAFAYPIGEARGGSTLTTILFLVGSLVLWRRERRALLALLLAPFGLGLLAAALGRYPYGGSARTMQYLAPAIVLLAGLGAARLLGLIGRSGRRLRALGIALMVLVMIGLIPAGLDVAQPYKFAEDAQARRFARWFWTAQARDGELACVKRDLGATIDGFHWETGRSAVYLCNQAIYSPRHRRGQGVAWDRVTDARPLRCVLYNVDRDHPEFAAWLAEMQARYRARRVVTYEPVPLATIGGLDYEDRYVVYEFVPRDGTAAVARTAVPEATRR